MFSEPMIPRGILVFFHCKSNTGYAIQTLEKVFYKMAIRFSQDSNKVHFGYLNLRGGRPITLPDTFDQIVEIDTSNCSKHRRSELHNYVSKNHIDVAFGFDQPVSRPCYSVLRKAGIKLFVSYWGAPMSSLNEGIKLYLKKLEVYLHRNKPDHFIFESKAMAETAVKGRGVNPKNVSIVPLGVDFNKFKPDLKHVDYAYTKFSIPTNRKIIYYSGHMEERKGVHVILEAAKELIENQNREDIHFLFLGNKNGEERKFDKIYKGSKSEDFITFGGYQDDIPSILCSCYLGVIASTGWDSFTMSSLEMASSSLPLIVSDLQGLRETLEPNKTGFLFTPGNSYELSRNILSLIDDPILHKNMAINSRNRIIAQFSEETQVDALVTILNKLYGLYCRIPT